METESEIAEAVDKAVSLKLQKLQAKLDKCIKEKKFLDDVCVLVGYSLKWLIHNFLYHNHSISCASFHRYPLMVWVCLLAGLLKFKSISYVQ